MRRLLSLLGLISPLACSDAERSATPYEPSTHEQSAVGFGFKCSWLAVKIDSADPVLKALKLHNVKPSNWKQGIEHAYEGTLLFVSPPVDGWVLVVGRALPDAGDGRTHPDAITPLTVSLSEQLDTTVQSFSTHRIVEYHAWAKAEGGELTRAYAYLGESGVTILDIGEASEQEQALGFHFFDERSPQAEEESYWDNDTLTYPDEEHVVQLAGRWSIDPTRLGDRTQPVVDGWLGSLP